VSLGYGYPGSAEVSQVPLFLLARLTAERVRSLFRQALHERRDQRLSGSRARTSALVVPGASPAPSWVDVEELLDRLAASGDPIPTALAPTTRIAAYDRGNRVRLESDAGSSWLDVDSIHECWETFERLGRIRRRDVLDPGRCSAFMFALFRQVPGVVEQAGADLYLVLPT
jgi:hypothetical protein